MPLETIFGLPDESYLDKELARYRRDPNEKGGFESGGISTYMFKNGLTTFRVLPPAPGAKAWHKEIYQHWVMTPTFKGPLTCPDVPGSGAKKVCPICEKYKMLLDSKDKESVELANRIRRQMKVMMNILLVGSGPPGGEFEEGKVYLAMSPKKVVTELLGYDKDEQSDFPDITGIRSAMEGNGIKGLYFKVIRSGAGISTSYSVQPTSKRVDLVEQLKGYNKTLDDIRLFDLFTVFPPKPLEDLQAIADQIEVVANAGVDTSVLDGLKKVEEPAAVEVTSSTFGIEPPKL